MKKILPLIVVLAFCFPFNAFSLPKYSLKVKKRCYECHYNRKGGGPLNSRGKYFSRHRSLTGYRIKVAKKTTRKKPRRVVRKKKRAKKPRKKVVVARKTKKKAPKVTKVAVVKPKITPEITKETPVFEVRRTAPRQKEVDLLAKTDLSANILLSFLVNENKVGPNDFHLMRAEPLVTTRVTDNFHTVFGYNFAMPLLTAYGQYQVENHYIQLGSFHVPFGLDSRDHNNIVSTLIKEQYDMTLDTRDIGVEVGYMKDFFFKAAITNGARAPRVRPTLLPTFDRNLGFVVNGGYQGVALAVPFLLGASYLYERRIPPGAVVKGVPPVVPVAAGRQPTWLVNLYGQFNVGDFSMLGEFAYGRHTPFVDDNSFGFYIRSAYNILDHWSISGRVELFARDRKFLSDNLTRYVISSEYHFSKYASIEPMIRINREHGVLQSLNDDEFFILAHMKF